MNSFTESSGLLKRSEEYFIEKSLRAAHRILLKRVMVCQELLLQS